MYLLQTSSPDSSHRNFRVTPTTTYHDCKMGNMQNQQEIGGAKALLLLGTKEPRLEKDQERVAHGHEIGNDTTASLVNEQDVQTTSKSQAEVHLAATQKRVEGSNGEENLLQDTNGLVSETVGEDSLSHITSMGDNIETHSNTHENLGDDLSGPSHLNGSIDPDDSEVHHNGNDVHADNRIHHEDSHVHHEDTDVHHEDNSAHDIFDKTSQQLNDAVEAAVMQYVGGTLANEDDAMGPDGGDPQNLVAGISPKRQRVQDDLMSDYHWDRFLEAEHVPMFERHTPRKRPRKNSMGGADIDPELADLHASPEHDLLVHAAIGDLAKELLIPETHAKLHDSIFLDTRRGSGNNARIRNHVGIHINNDHVSAGPGAGTLGQVPIKSRSEQITKSKRAPKTGSPLNSDLDHDFALRLKYNSHSIEELVKEAAHEAHLWFSAQTNVGARGPRLFAPEEISIVDNFIQAYCRLNDLTRTQICERVWCMDKPKDRFWENLTKVLPYRSRASVYKHVRRQFHVFRVRATWNKEEDEQLRSLAEQSPTLTNWKRIGETMNRMPEDCRDRWRNYLKCGENRLQNKWSEDEESTLKQIVLEYLSEQAHKDKPVAINWTLVSEKMNGMRSRIQCRYKWNKLVRHDLVARISMMGLSTKIWLLNRLMDLNVQDRNDINWEYIAQSFHGEHKDGKDKNVWSGKDFQMVFEVLQNSVWDHKSIPLHTVISKLLSVVYLTPGPDNDQLMKIQARPKETIAAEHEAASVANAAVAAVSSGINGQDAQHQEYSLWR